MRIGLIGIGVVGGVLKRWFEENTDHELRLYDPGKGFAQDLSGSEAIFIAVPVPAKSKGQDLEALKQSVFIAKCHTQNVFIRSTVLPGTNDDLGTISMPEFLTERRAYQDFCDLPIVVGRDGQDIIQKIFRSKVKVYVSNIEAELTKYAHNCFGALKVTYFNIIEELCRKLGVEYYEVIKASMLTGFINEHHTFVPGPDGKRGYGGKCFPENISSMKNFLMHEYGLKMTGAGKFFEKIEELNRFYRGQDGIQTTNAGVNPNTAPFKYF